MRTKKLDSKLIRRIMAGATDEEIAAATELWFNYLHLLDAHAAELDHAGHDSRDLGTYATLAGNPFPTK